MSANYFLWRWGLLGAFCLIVSIPALADEATEQRWIASEFQPSTLTPADQQAEIAWFAAAAKPLAGVQIRVASETTPAHEYQGKVLAVAFFQITGIAVGHDLLREDQVSAELDKALAGHSDYDGLVVDADSVGTLAQSSEILDLDAWMAGEGRAVTDPRLDPADLIGPTAPNDLAGSRRLLPLTRYPLLYWFRQDWFADAGLRQRFRARFGRDLGVPQSWAAYGDIARFFSQDVGTIDGHLVYGHLDGPFEAARQGWRTARDWALLAGATPCAGGALPADGPAAQAALGHRLDWLTLAPPAVAALNPLEVATLPARGRIAQVMAWDSSFADEFLLPSRQTQGFDGVPKWRVAPAPSLGRTAERGAVHGSGAVLLRSTAADRRQAAWLYEQFLASRSVSLKTAHVGLSVVRTSDLDAPSFTERASLLGGLVEALRSPAMRDGNGTYVGPADAKLAPLWSAAMADVVTKRQAPEAALTDLAAAQTGLAGACPGSAPSLPAPASTIGYDALVRSWRATR